MSIASTSLYFVFWAYKNVKTHSVGTRIFDKDGLRHTLDTFKAPFNTFDPRLMRKRNKSSWARLYQLDSVPCRVEPRGTWT